jgi:hypothetical protein
MIHITCECGKAYELEDTLTGKTVKCPNCQKVLKVPNVAPPLNAPPAVADENSELEESSVVERLMKENYLLKILVFVSLAVGGISLVWVVGLTLMRPAVTESSASQMAAAEVSPEAQNVVHDIVRARRLEIIDADGRLVSVLEPTETGSLFGLYDKSGSVVAGMQTTEGGGLLSLHADEVPRVVMRSSGNGGGILVHDDDGDTVGLVAGTKDGGMVSVLGKDRKGVGALTATESGVAFSLTDARNITTASITGTDLGGNLELFDSSGNEAVGIAAGEYGGSLVIMDSLGNKRAEMMVFDSVACFDLLNAEGVSVAAVNTREGYGNLRLNDNDMESFVTANASDNMASISLRNDRHASVILTDSKGDPDGGSTHLTWNQTGGGMFVSNDVGENILVTGTDDWGRGVVAISDGRGEGGVTLSVDQNGDGEVGAWNSRGKGRTLSPGD